MDNQTLITPQALNALLFQYSFWILICFAVVLQFGKPNGASSFENWPKKVSAGIAWGFGCQMLYFITPYPYRPNVAIAFGIFFIGGMYTDEVILRVTKLLLNRINEKQEKKTDDATNN